MGQQFDSLYRLSWRCDASIAAFGLSTNAAIQYLQQKLKPLTPDQINLLDKNDVPAFDRHALENYDATANALSDGFLYSSLVLPGFLLLDQDIRKDVPKISILLAESILVSTGVTGLTKRLVRRERPYLYNPAVPADEKQTLDGRLSFFSGHTSLSATMTFFTARLWCDYHPNSQLKAVVWGLAAAIPATTGYLRIKAGKHFLSDVATGYVVGALVGSMVPALHKVSAKPRGRLQTDFSMLFDHPVVVTRLWF